MERTISKDGWLDMTRIFSSESYDDIEYDDQDSEEE